MRPLSTVYEIKLKAVLFVHTITIVYRTRNYNIERQPEPTQQYNKPNNDVRNHKTLVVRKFVRYVENTLRISANYFNAHFSQIRTISFIIA